MRFSINNLFKKLFSRQKPLESQPEPQAEPQKKGGAFQGHRAKPPSKWILTHNRLVRQKSKRDRKRRAKNKMARLSRQINRRAA